MSDLAKNRADDIANWLSSLDGGAWPFLAAELRAKRDALVQQLIGKDNEETRGRIKALQDVLNLPETLSQEREGINAGLADAPAL